MAENTGPLCVEVTAAGIRYLYPSWHNGLIDMAPQPQARSKLSQEECATYCSEAAVTPVRKDCSEFFSAEVWLRE